MRYGKTLLSFTQLLQNIMGRRNCTFIISNSLQKILEERANYNPGEYQMLMQQLKLRNIKLRALERKSDIE